MFRLSAVTKLIRAELQCVVGYEMGHIANWDISYMTAVGILVGRGTSSSDNSSSVRPGGRAAVLILIAIVVLFSIIAPITVSFVCCAVSRQC